MVAEPFMYIAFEMRFSENGRGLPTTASTSVQLNLNTCKYSDTTQPNSMEN